ncbi:hypothetical protein TUM17576_55200 [Enterobacter hormaechei]|nr:DUF2514 family protein [Enterobacter hormaechei]GJL38700.1 hypothetical protein TUM17576_55200 [Enterobacter hormaechei]
MIASILKAYWKPLAALLLVVFIITCAARYGYDLAENKWQAKWQARDLADLQAKQVFTEQQRRIELQRQGAIDDIQAQAENDIAKAQRNAAIADAESKRLQDGIADAIARLQADIGNPGASISSKTRASTSSLLAVLFREIDAAAGDYAAEADRARKAGLRCEAAYDAVRSSNDLTK